MATRKPASVLPDPVGAAISVSRPAAIARPALALRLGRALGEAAPEPRGHRGVEPGEDRLGERQVEHRAATGAEHQLGRRAAGGAPGGGAAGGGGRRRGGHHPHCARRV